MNVSGNTTLEPFDGMLCSEQRVVYIDPLIFFLNSENINKLYELHKQALLSGDFVSLLAP